VYPAIWDAREAYEEIAGVASAYLTIPMLTRPVFAVRAGGKKLIGDFPYFDAAFIGGGGSLRTEHRQRYAGDASLYGSGELRVPIAKFPFILPWNVGALGFVDVARVYVDGDSPGGWHKGTGLGGWIGVINPETSLSVYYTNNPDRRVQTTLGFTF
jgi:hemolysin activation/secretion protein